MKRKRHLAHEQEPLPLALFSSGCLFRDWTLAALIGSPTPTPASAAFWPR
ncbi:MAG TPA: hypothetical protein P5102_15790 [Candidatus Competibacteraceae bacterium]|nr:hypothetical protein [Candidatus Competibacteraceae bacterium]